MKVGLIGAGGFARATALPGFALLPDADVTAIYDVNVENARKTAEMFGIGTVCDTLEEFLALDLDLVYLAVPPGPQHKLVSAVIEAKHNFLVEKPTGQGSLEVKDLLEKAEAAGLIHAVDHEMRFGALYRTIKKLLDDGYVGNIRQVSLSVFVDYGVNPYYPSYYCGFATLKSQSGGILRQVGSHFLDLIHFLFGQFEATGGYATTMMKERPAFPKESKPYELVDPSMAGPLQPVDADDAAILVGHLPNGAPVSVNMGWSVHHSPGTRWEIYGDEGTLRFQSETAIWGGPLLGGKKGDPGLSEIELLPEYLDNLPENQPRYLVSCFAMAAADIFKAIAGERDGRIFCTLRDEMNVWKCIEQIDPK